MFQHWPYQEESPDFLETVKTEVGPTSDCEEWNVRRIPLGSDVMQLKVYELSKYLCVHVIIITFEYIFMQAKP